MFNDLWTYIEHSIILCVASRFGSALKVITEQRPHQSLRLYLCILSKHAAISYRLSVIETYLWYTSYKSA